MQRRASYSQHATKHELQSRPAAGGRTPTSPEGTAKMVLQSVPLLRAHLHLSDDAWRLAVAVVEEGAVSEAHALQHLLGLVTAHAVPGLGAPRSRGQVFDGEDLRLRLLLADGVGGVGGWVGIDGRSIGGRRGRGTGPPTTRGLLWAPTVTASAQCLPAGRQSTRHQEELPALCRRHGGLRRRATVAPPRAAVRCRPGGRGLGARGLGSWLSCLGHLALRLCSGSSTRGGGGGGRRAALLRRRRGEG